MADGLLVEVTGRRISGDLKQIATGLAELSIQAGATYLWPSFGGASATVSAGASVFKGLSLKDKPGLRAWRLIAGGLAHAIDGVLLETELHRKPNKVQRKELIDRSEALIKSSKVEIDLLFLDHPTQLSIYRNTREYFCHWLATCEPADDEPVMKARFDKHFVGGLHRTWIQKPEYFSDLEQYLDSPFSESRKRGREREAYLQSLIDTFESEPIFGQEDEPKIRQATLGRLYVPLRAYFKEQIQSEDDGKSADVERGFIEGKQFANTRRHVVDLHEVIDDWIIDRNPDDAIRLISGGPGSGKSSFAKALCAYRSRDRRAFPLYFPLQRFDLERVRLRENISSQLINNRNCPLNHTPLLHIDDLVDMPILLVFDGLDELVKPGEEAEEITRDVLSDIRELLRELNGQGKPAEAMALVTGRTAAAQSAQQKAKLAEEQVLHTLRYYYPESRRRSGNYIRKDFYDERKLLEQDQRKGWWISWSDLKQLVNEQNDLKLFDSDLEDLTTEPLLLYLLVLSGLHKGSKEGKINRNEMYRRLFADYFARDQKKSHTLAHFLGNQEQYEQVIQAMALAAWYGSGRSASITDVEDLLSTDLRTSLKEFLSQKKPQVGLAASFYARQGEAPNSFEFTHKSFGEYLTARRMVQEVADTYAILESQQQSPAVVRRQGLEYTHHSALLSWLRLTGRRPLDKDLFQFLKAEFQMPEHVDNLASWRDMLVALNRLCVSDGMPAEELCRTDRFTFKQACTWARNAEETLLGALSAVSFGIRRDELPQQEFAKLSVSIWTDHVDLSLWKNDFPIFFGQNWRESYFMREGAAENNNIVEYLNRLRGEGVIHSNIFPKFLNSLKFSDMLVQGVYLREADFSYSFFGFSIWDANTIAISELHGCDLRFSTFLSSGFYSVEFAHSNAKYVHFYNCKLSRCFFDGADLSYSMFIFCDLANTQFGKAKLRGVDFTESDLSGTDLSKCVDLWRSSNLDTTKNLNMAQLPSGWSVRRKSNGKWSIKTPTGAYKSADQLKLPYGNVHEVVNSATGQFKKELTSVIEIATH